MQPSPLFSFVIRSIAPVLMVFAGISQVHMTSVSPKAACDQQPLTGLERFRDLVTALLIAFPVAAIIIYGSKQALTWELAVQHSLEFVAWLLVFYIQMLEIRRFATVPYVLQCFAVAEMLLLIEEVYDVAQEPNKDLPMFVLLLAQYSCNVIMGALAFAAFRRVRPEEMWWNMGPRFRHPEARSRLDSSASSVSHEEDTEITVQPSSKQLSNKLLDESAMRCAESGDALPLKGPLSVFVRQTDIVGEADGCWTVSNVLGMSQYCIFTVRVKWDKSNIWDVKRRFSDFLLLRHFLTKMGFKRSVAVNVKGKSADKRDPKMSIQKDFEPIHEVLPAQIGCCDCCKRNTGQGIVGMVQSLNQFLQEVLSSPEPKHYEHFRAFCAEGRVYVKEKFSDALTIYDFQLLSVVGKGSYGKVMQAKKKDSGKIYAIKVLLKKDLKKQNQIQHTQTERHILGAVTHPFICSLRYAFQTQTKLYMVMDFFNGGELFFHLNKGPFDEPRTKFYIAEIVLALEHLHGQLVVYRDLKPENVLLDSDGHIKLSDFGLSKKFKKGQACETRTFCGTPQYVAPEIIQGKGYGFPVDWWALGCLTYELLTRKPPFEAKTAPQLYSLIQTANVGYPSSMSANARGFISALMQKNPAQRLGTSGAADVRLHPFFEGIDWKLLLEKRLEVPFKPPQDLEDTSNVWQDFLDDEVKDTLIEPPMMDSLDRNLPGFTFAPQTLNVATSLAVKNAFTGEDRLPPVPRQTSV